MGANSNIEWTDHTFNPWIGCTKVSPACDGCYAEAMMDLRYGRVEWGAPGKGNGTRVRTSAGNWKQPIKWNKDAAAAGARPRVFCASLADVFDNHVPPEWRADLFELIAATPNLVWLLLTKRPQNIVKMVRESGAFDDHGRRSLPKNAALGTTIEDQTRADINVPSLLDAKHHLSPAFAFASCEPLLGLIDLRRICLLPQKPGSHRAGIHIDALAGRYCESGLRYTGPWDIRGPAPTDDAPAVTIDQVIVGGETDQGKHKARPMHPDWPSSLLGQCEGTGTKFFFKQWGEWAPHKPIAGGDLGGDVRAGRVRIVHPTGQTDVEVFEATGGRNTIPGSRYMARIGKKKSGRLLAGVEHNGMPEVRG